MYTRPQLDPFLKRIREPRRFLQVVTGPRQVGKTTLVRQAVELLDLPVVSVSADEPTLRDQTWLRQQWERVRLSLKEAGSVLLVVDEVQKIPAWSETVKALWDEDTAAGRDVRVVVLGSSSLLLQQGLTESLAGRFEVTRLPHWSFTEMRDAFGWDLERYLYFGAYPGAAPLVDDEERWTRYIADSLIETTVSRDIMLLTRVDKPALLRRLFHLGCRYSGQVLSYQKMVGQLQDAGNTTTLAHYLDLLSGAGLLTGLEKYAGSEVRRRGSSPKLQVLNAALLAVASGMGYAQAMGNPEIRGRFVESAVGSHLLNGLIGTTAEAFYWRDRNREVDFVVEKSGSVVAIEVKSGRRREGLPGIEAFRRRHPGCRSLLVGGDGIPLEEFLSSDPSSLV